MTNLTTKNPQNCKASKERSDMSCGKASRGLVLGPRKDSSNTPNWKPNQGKNPRKCHCDESLGGGKRMTPNAPYTIRAEKIHQKKRNSSDWGGEIKKAGKQHLKDIRKKPRLRRQYIKKCPRGESSPDLGEDQIGTPGGHCVRFRTEKSLRSSKWIEFCVTAI